MIGLIKSSFYNELDSKKKLARFILESEKFSMGTYCAEFEKLFSKKQNRKYSVYVNSGSSANLILIQAILNLGLLQKGDKVGFSALTWATNVMPLIQLGLDPIPIDCELENLNSSKEKISEIDDLKAVFLTNTLGFSDDISAIKDYCNQKNILLIEDNCESLGSIVDGELLGNFGLASTFSFFAGHHLSTIEGGMVCTDSEELYHQLLMARSHGWDRSLPEEKRSDLSKEYNVNDFYSKYTFFDLAYNIRPTEVNGFLGTIQIDYWDEIVQKRSENFSTFLESLNSNENFIRLDLSHMDLISNFAVPLICKDKKIFERYKRTFDNKNVEIRPIISGDITQQPFFKKYTPYFKTCENAKFIHENGFYFGNNPELTEDEVRLLDSLLQD